ncbi:hypothetical protein SAG0136_06350 [Streptococcus agalactiae LMG 14747]|uniref:Uncharacterized protein n=1 Tax=Streptococcus agalactiae LMG 14747 TaxID=1154860 RepID=V6Z3M6_STRAG|nr:hypothetical protein SAG0136_06350 [Streptococcus agalactiae LMG 14747]
MGISPKLKKARRQNQLVCPSPTFFNIACVATHAKLATRRGEGLIPQEILPKIWKEKG